MPEQSEEKTLPATQKKLRDGRKKGQTSKSKDFVSAGGLLAAILYLFIAYPYMHSRLVVVVDNVARVSQNTTSSNTLSELTNSVNLSSTVLLYFFVPLVISVIGAVIITGIISTLGPVFSFELVKINFEHINPIKGLERIFSVRNVVDFFKNLAKVLILGVVLGVVIYLWVQSLFEIPTCGLRCASPILMSALKPIAIIAIIAFLLIGFIDMLIQRSLFLRDMRMTKTEYKREQKDLEGDPLIRSHRRRVRISSAFEPPLGLKRATFVIYGDHELIAFKYDGKRVRVPTVVAKSKPETFASMLSQAREMGLPVIEDEKLVASIFRKHSRGQMLKQDYFSPVIMIMRGMRLI